MLEEQRAHRRYPILLTGSATTGRARFEVVCTNIGPGGAFFASRVDPPAAAEVEITLHVGGAASPPVALTGAVVYITDRGNGRVGGFGVRWLRALSNFGVEPLRYLLAEVVRVADTGDLAADESGTATFEFGKPVRATAPVHFHVPDPDDCLTEVAEAYLPFEPGSHPDADLARQLQPEPVPEQQPEAEPAPAPAHEPATPPPAYVTPSFFAAPAAPESPAAKPFASDLPITALRESTSQGGVEPPRPRPTSPSFQLVAPGSVETQARRIFAAPAGDAPIEIEGVPAHQAEPTGMDDPFAPAEFAVGAPPPQAAPAAPSFAAPVEPDAKPEAAAAEVPAPTPLPVAVAAVESVPGPVPVPVPIRAAAPQAAASTAGRTSSIMRRLAASRASAPMPVARQAAPPPPPPREAPPATGTRLSSVLRRVRESQAARASQSLAPVAAPPPPAPEPIEPLMSRVAPPHLESRKPASILVAAAVDAQKVTSEHAVNEHTVAYTRENAPMLRGKHHVAPPPAWPAGIPVSLSERYGNLELIGQGGHGVVYKATDLHLNRQVVLKFLAQSSMATEMARKYFLREVKLAASLNHSNIVHIYDIAKVEDVLYYAMEYVDGVPLTAFLPVGTPLADEAFLFSVFTQICDALDHAHQQGVLHRDVKPENVLVAPDGTVKLFDFGLAWAQGEGFGEQSVLMGTPYYMAPEQLLGADVDHRADIYALGVVLFRMLAGVLPFSEGNIFAAHAIEPVPDPRKFNPVVAPAAVAVVRKMMAKQPAQRPMDCRSAAVELYHALFVDRGGVL